jgi:serralysin
VAAGDVDGDGRADVIVSVGAKGPPQVTVFSGADGSVLSSFLAFVDPNHADPGDPAYFTSAFQGGVDVAAGDMGGDGSADLIVSAGPGGGPHVKIFANGQPTAMTGSFFAYDPGFAGGVNVAVGDVDGDGAEEILTSPGRGAEANVKVFGGTDGSLRMSFLAYDAGFRGGVHLASGDYDGDGQYELFTVPAGGAASDVRRFGFADGQPVVATEDFFAFDQDFVGGAAVAA